MTTDLFRRPGRTRLVGALLCVLFLMGLLISVLFNEWRLNPQYRYGFFVPLLVGLLVWRRMVALPAPQARDSVRIRVGIFAVVLSAAAIDILHRANPDWRFSLWVYAVVTFLGVFLILEWKFHAQLD